MPGKYEVSTSNRTAEQTALFELARSRQLREDSHTSQDQMQTGKPAAGGQAPSAEVPNPRYQGLGGVFNVVADALGGSYQPTVRK